VDQPTPDRPAAWGEPGHLPSPPPPLGPPTKRSHRLWILGVAGASAVLLLVAVVLAAIRIGDTGQLATATQPSATTPPAVTPATDAPATTEAATALAFGDTQVYDDGTEVTVSVGKRRQISELAAGGDRARDHLLPVVVRIKAGRSAIELPPDVALLHGAGGQVADDVFDEGIDAMQNAPSVLRPHKTVSGTFGFAVPKGRATAIIVAVTPGFDYTESTFEGRV
jgi:hypothetical protein